MSNHHADVVCRDQDAFMSFEHFESLPEGQNLDKPMPCRKANGESWHFLVPQLLRRKDGREKYEWLQYVIYLTDGIPK